ncbi:MAG TPA: cytochrome c peroxidase, partial [Blastocatellia bacterium]|nr:cytochrome c peroxidase [Blastocatellia bacterium]
MPSASRICCLVTVLAIFALIGFDGRAQKARDRAAAVALGARLFMETGFSSKNGDLVSSCSSCHMFDEDPQGVRAFTDFLARSWVSWRAKDPRRDGLRNAPTILDAGESPRLHFDGEFGSLEELVKGTISGRTLGWLPDEREEALDQAYRVMVEGYRRDFLDAFGADVRRLGRDEAIDLAARSISDYVRTLKTKRDSPYDRFIAANRLDRGPARGERSDAFARRMLQRISSLEAKRELRLAEGFGPGALEGMKIFFRTDGAASAGNCVSCHTPPLFTDFSFHNMGISQGEYDRLHGEGSFASLEIPGAARAVRPSPRLREIPSRDKPGVVDLGHWNFVDLATSPLRRRGESEDRFLQRMIATFKTPTLRNLAFSQPYMHNGAFPSLESALEEIMRMSEMARAGRVREADEGLARIRITEADIARLVD